MRLPEETSRRPAAAGAVRRGIFIVSFLAAGLAPTGPVRAVAPAAASHSAASSRQGLDPILFKDLAWRSIGPANMGGRVSSFAVVESKPNTFYVGFGTGGVFKTANLGTTWSAVFEKQPVASIGAVAVWQKNPEAVWVGTGEANNRNSSSWGNGVYRSADGGGTWNHLGLERTHNIAYLLRLLADHDFALPPNSDDVSALTPWATDFRYEDSAGRAINRARTREVVQAVRDWAEGIIEGPA